MCSIIKIKLRQHKHLSCASIIIPVLANTPQNACHVTIHTRHVGTGVNRKQMSYSATGCLVTENTTTEKQQW